MLERARRMQQGFESACGSRRSDQKHTTRTGGTGFGDLIWIDEKILAHRGGQPTGPSARATESSCDIEPSKPLG